MLFTQLKKFIKKCSDDNIAAFSAQAAFFIVLSVYPLALIILSVVKYLYGNTDIVFNLTKDFLPEWLVKFLYSYFYELSELSEGIIISFALIAVLYSSAKGMLAVIHGISKIVEGKNYHRFIFLRVKAFIFTFIFIISILCVVGVLIFGNKILHQLQFVIQNVFLVNLIRMFVAIILLTVILTLMYMFSPLKRKSLSAQLPGALLCSTGWICFSYLYTFYIGYMDRHSLIYGSISSPVLFMLWLYFCMYMLFLGVEFNCVLNFKLCKTQGISDNKK